MAAPLEIDPVKTEKSGQLCLSGGKGEERKIPFAKSVAELKSIAATRRIIFKGKKIVPDFFMPFELLLKIVPNGKQWEIEGCIVRANRTYRLNEALFACLGPPHWVIIDHFLYILNDDAPWKWIKRCSDKEPWPVSQEKAIEIIQECRDLDISCDASLFEKEEPIAPTPILQLKDRSGVLADLIFDYDTLGSFSSDDPYATLKNGSNRHREQEKAFEADLLETAYKKKLVESANFYCPQEKVIESLTLLLEIGWKVKDYKGKTVLLQTGLDLSSSMQQERLYIRGRINFGDASLPIAEALQSIASKNRWLDLGMGRVGLLTDSKLIQEAPYLLADVEATEDGLAISPRSASAILPLEDALAITTEGALSDLTGRLRDFTKIKPHYPSNKFHGTLRDYQQQGLNWLGFLYSHGFSGILADDMGLGKTVQTLAFLSTLPMSAPTLIVVPKTLLVNWQKEAERFLEPDIAAIYHGKARSELRDRLPSCKIIITTYHTLRLEIDLFRSMTLEAVILDEAQTIKNDSSQIFRAVLLLNAPFRLSITGTPIENRIEELWTQFRFLMPELLGSKEKFADDILQSSGNTFYLRRLQKKLKPFIMRRRKLEVAKELPEKIEQVIWTEMDESQRTAYETLLQSYKNNLLKKVSLDGISSHRMEVFEAILRLRQICCHPLLADAMLPEESRSSCKMEALMLDLETIVSQSAKVLVYSQFTSMLKLIKNSIRDKGWPCLYLDGSTQNRHELVEQFQKSEKEQIFLISLKAGGVGLNLTAADYVILYDPWWNDAVENQAIDRAHRIGRVNTVIAKRLIVKDSIEERMMALKEQKRSLVEELIDDKATATNLSIENFRFLLS